MYSYLNFKLWSQELAVISSCFNALEGVPYGAPAGRNEYVLLKINAGQVIQTFSTRLFLISIFLWNCFQNIMLNGFFEALNEVVYYYMQQYVRLFQFAVTY